MSQDRENLAHFMPAPVQDFQPRLEGLSNRERVIVEILSNAVRYVGKVYVHQQPRFRQPYPHNVSSEKIRQAADTNPAIFSPYTFVDLDASGNLKTTPYHELFKSQLEPVSQYLLDAANVATHDPDLQLYLKTRAKNLLDGNYEESEAIWLGQPNARIRLIIGPYDRYPDGRFNRKFYYGGMLDIRNEKASEHHQQIVSSLLEAWKKSDIPDAETPEPRVRIRIGTTVLTSGLPAEMKITANSLPCQREWREKYGTEIIVLEPAFISTFYARRLPLIRQIIHPDLRKRQSDEELLEAYGLRFDGHETPHALIRFEGDQERLGNEYLFTNEMTATVVGLALLKDLGLSKKQLEGILIAQLAVTADEYKTYLSGDHSKDDYLDGDLIIFERLVKNGLLAIDKEGRVIWDDINAIFDSFKLDAKKYVGILKSGNINNVKPLKSRWGSADLIKTVLPFRLKTNTHIVEAINYPLNQAILDNPVRVTPELNSLIN